MTTDIKIVSSQLIACGQKLYQRGFLAGTDGNLSARLSNDSILITASGVSKGEMTNAHLTQINFKGDSEPDSPKPSSENAMHLAVYNNRAEINACVHSHPVYTTALAVAGIELPEDILPEIVLFVGKVALTKYAAPGTAEVPESIEPFLADHNAFILANHGLLTIGRSIEEAYNRHETVEHFAKIYFLAKQLGEIRKIPPTDFERLQQMRLELERTRKS